MHFNIICFLNHFLLFQDWNGQTCRPTFVRRHQKETTEGDGQQTVARKVWDPDQEEERNRWSSFIVKLWNRAYVRAFRTDLVTS